MITNGIATERLCGVNVRACWAGVRKALPARGAARAALDSGELEKNAAPDVE